MICIFCRNPSNDSCSVEHIIPESLGNHTLVLPPGVVCDSCNNYFSRKVEKQFLESPAIKSLRFHEEILSKKGKIPSLDGVLTPGFHAKFSRDPKKDSITSVSLSEDALRHLACEGKGVFLLSAEPPSPLVLSRFMAKVALECMALRLINYPDGLEYIATEIQLDVIREHARKGTIKEWPVSVRRIYEQDAQWVDENGNFVQRVHESDIIQTNSGEWFFILAIFGLELAINYGGPEIEGYYRWLEEHENVSPLYCKGDRL